MRAEAKYGHADGKQERYVCGVYWSGGLLRSLSIKEFTHPDDCLSLIRKDGNAEIARVHKLIEEQIGKFGTAKREG